MVIFIPQNIWEKQLIRFLARNLSCHKTHRFKPKLAAGRTNNIELLMLALDLVVDSRLKILNGISVESMECLNKDA